MQWETKVPIFKNPIILRGLGLALGLPFSVLIAVILITAKGDVAGTDAKYALLLIGILFLLTFLLVMLLYGGKYSPVYIIDDKGITNYSQTKEAKKNRAVNKLLMILGALSGNMTAVGTGMMNQSRQVVHIKWKSIRKIKSYPKQYAFMIKGGFAEKIAVFCTPENYGEVYETIRKNCSALN